MQFSPLPLSVTTFAGTTQPSLAGLQGLENFAESTPDQGGLFGLILAQLNAGQPVAVPVPAGSGPVIAEVATQIAATDLPPTGKPLPLVLPETAVEPLPPLTVVEVATPGAIPGEALLPLPVLPQPLKQAQTQRPLSASAMPMPAAIPKHTPAPKPTPVLTDQPLPTQPVVVVRDASIEATPSRPELSTANRLLVAELPENFVLPQQNTTPSHPSVAPSPSLNPAPAPAPAAPVTSPPPQHTYTLNQPVADPQWGNELGQRLIWMNDNGIGRAELRMNPPDLGPVEVRIAISNDDARVAFQVQHGATREALENAMPRLREMFASQGLNLSDANVSEQSAQNQSQAGRSGADTGGNDGSFEQLGGEMADAPDQVRAASLDGMIDTYA